MLEQDLSEIETDLLIEELKDRGALSKFNTDDLVEALQEKSKVTCIETKYRHQDYAVAIENGQIYKDTGKVTILIVEA